MALALPAGHERVAQTLADLKGCERAMLSPSTLHLFWDLFGVLARRSIAIYLDAGTYPIARWGVERAEARGIPVRCFPHHDTEALRHWLRKDAPLHRRPWVVADGFCPACGRPAPMGAYLESARALGGHLVIDDTQALGILGHSPGPHAPYGKGGGGSLQWAGIGGPDVLVVSSLAKGFGAPVAVLAGSEAMVRHFEENSETRVHCSPPSAAVIHAAEHALAISERFGDRLRLRLAQLIRHFHNRLKGIGLSATGGLFPVQALVPPPGLDAKTLYDRLLQCGIWTVLHRGRNGHRPRIGFLVTARHRQDDIDRAVDALAYAIPDEGIQTTRLEVGYEVPM